MIVSMTGYGQGVASDEATTVTVEVRTVNHRFLDLSIKVPRVLQARERDIKDIVKGKLTRGRVYVTMSIESEHPEQGIAINAAVMETYLKQLREFAAGHGIDDNIGVRDLVGLPDAVTTSDEDADVDALWPLVEKGLSGALDACCEMREEEGATLAKDLSERMQVIGETVGEIEKIAPGVARAQADALRARVQQLMGDVHIDEDRLTTEISLMAERLDFTEEITRLRSHESQFNNSIETGGEVSKKLTYLLQEMHREASTIGAKASNSDVIQHVVRLKEETEKIREQVQNIE